MPADRFALLPYDVKSAADMRATLARCRGLGAGYVYVTDATGANPWD